MSVKEGKQDYGIQPFQIQDDESVVEFLQRTTWFEAMTKALQKHSEFMQPQNNPGEYPNMEYGYPDYTNPNYTLPPDTAEGNINPRGGGCVISCYAPLYCYEPVECHFSVSQTPTGMNPAEAPSHWQMEARETNPTTTPPLREKLVSGDRLSIVSHQSHAEQDKLIRDQNSGLPTQVMERKRTEGVAAIRDSIFMLRISPPSGDWPHWPEQRSTLLYVRAMDAAGNICHTKLSVFCRIEDCCSSDGYVAMTFDDASTADTIAKNSSITVYVLNGCPPYTWTVSGTGYSFATSTTTTPSNTLSLANTDCGVHAAQCTITMTDNCGTTVTAKIKATDGTWELIAGFGRSSTCDLAVCAGVLGKTCAADGTWLERFHYGVGAGGAYDAKWSMLVVDSNQECREESNGNHTLGTGSSCGADTILGTEYSTSALCDCEGNLYYWTCGTDCT